MQQSGFNGGSRVGDEVRPPLYRVIANDVRTKIQSGEYMPGDRLMSVGDLCEHYNVSLATAHRSIGEMVNMGMVRTIPRKGVYVTGIPAPPGVEKSGSVERIILVESLAQRRSHRDRSTRLSGFSGRLVEAILHACREHRIPLDCQFIPVDQSATPRVYFTPRSGDGIIAIGAQVSIALMSHLETPNVPSVLVDAAAANAHCVLTDNYDGMYQVVRHLAALGHRRIVMASCFATRVVNSTNENERRDALLHHARISGMDVKVVDSGDWDDLFGVIDGPHRPTAVVFSRDVAAVEFIHRARRDDYDVPGNISVVGFDDWAHDKQALAELTTVRVDVDAMGKAAVEMVRKPPVTRGRLFAWERIRPELVSRASVARASQYGS